MTILVAIFVISLVMALYFYVQTFKPVIMEHEGFWVIRVQDHYVDYVALSLGKLNNNLLLWTAPEPVCLFPFREEAEFYFKHVCNFTEQGKFFKYPKD